MEVPTLRGMNRSQGPDIKSCKPSAMAAGGAHFPWYRLVKRLKKSCSCLHVCLVHGSPWCEQVNIMLMQQLSVHGPGAYYALERLEHV